MNDESPPLAADVPPPSFDDVSGGLGFVRVVVPTPWYRSTLARLTRGQLLDLAVALGVVDPDATEDDDDVYPEDVPAALTRMDLIDRVRAVVDLDEYPEEPGSEYPLRRERSPAVPNWLIPDGDKVRVVVCHESDWDGALGALIDEDPHFRWHLGDELQAGDIVVTVLGTSPALVVALERVDDDGAQRMVVGDTQILHTPLSWDTVADRAGADLSRFSGPLSPKASREVLEALVDLLYSPAPLPLTAGPCRPGEGEHAAVRVAYFVREATEGFASPECASCQRTFELVELELHFDRPTEEPLRLDIAEHVDDVAMLCGDCHILAHPHPVMVQEVLVRPSCPTCGARQAIPILWGMPAYPPPAGSAPGGCVIPIGPTPQWVCGACESRYLVVSSEELSRWGVQP